jgi:hypothetical protein
MRPWSISLLFLLLNCPQNIPRPGDIGQINLGLLFRRSVSAGRIRRGLSTTGQGGTHTPGFVFLNRTGVRFLLCNANLWEDVENDSALDFQLSC